MESHQWSSTHMPPPEGHTAATPCPTPFTALIKGSYSPITDVTMATMGPGVSPLGASVHLLASSCHTFSFFLGGMPSFSDHELRRCPATQCHCQRSNHQSICYVLLPRACTAITFFLPGAVPGALPTLLWPPQPVLHRGSTATTILSPYYVFYQADT
jgi:hypothetical protein